jgi:hypothetical protein
MASEIIPETEAECVFDDADAGPEFRVEAVFENRYGDLRAAVDTPAPWDTPDGARDANEVVKGLPWDEGEAEEQGAPACSHHTFEDEAAGAEDVWVVDAAALRVLRERARAAGHGWAGPRDRAEALEAFDGARGAALVDNPAPETGDALELRRLCGEAGGGDRVEVTYEKANGNGRAARSGEVRDSVAVSQGPGCGFAMSSGRSKLLLEEDDGKVKRLRPDGSGEVGLYHSGQYPYMGRVVEVALGGC